MRRQTKLRKRLQLRQKKLSRAVQLAVLSMSLTPSTVLADVQIDADGLGAAAFLGSTITNTETITPAGDYLDADDTNTKLTGAITNSGTIEAGDDAFQVSSTSDISGNITNSGTITAGDHVFEVAFSSDISSE